MLIVGQEFDEILIQNAKVESLGCIKAARQMANCTPNHNAPQYAQSPYSKMETASVEVEVVAPGSKEKFSKALIGVQRLLAETRAVLLFCFHGSAYLATYCCMRFRLVKH